MIRIRIQDAQKHIDPTDPDPQHWWDVFTSHHHCHAFFLQGSPLTLQSYVLQAVLQIHVILVWIRADSCLWQKDPDPAIFVIDLQDANKNLILKKFFCLLLFECTLTSFFIKSQKEVTKQWESRFSYYFCLMIEGSGSIPLTTGSGSRRPKNIWIRRIRIRNTGMTFPSHHFHSFFYTRLSINFAGKKIVTIYLFNIQWQKSFQQSFLSLRYSTCSSI